MHLCQSPVHGVLDGLGLFELVAMTHVHLHIVGHRLCGLKAAVVHSTIDRWPSRCKAMPRTEMVPGLISRPSKISALICAMRLRLRLLGRSM